VPLVPPKILQLGSHRELACAPSSVQAVMELSYFHSSTYLWDFHNP
jgi:hypothetical protein